MDPTGGMAIINVPIPPPVPVWESGRPSAVVKRMPTAPVQFAPVDLTTVTREMSPRKWNKLYVDMAQLHHHQDVVYLTLPREGDVTPLLPSPAASDASTVPYSPEPVKKAVKRALATSQLKRVRRTLEYEQEEQRSCEAEKEATEHEEDVAASTLRALM